MRSVFNAIVGVATRGLKFLRSAWRLTRGNLTQLKLAFTDRVSPSSQNIQSIFLTTFLFPATVTYTGQPARAHAYS